MPSKRKTELGLKTKRSYKGEFAGGSASDPQKNKSVNSSRVARENIKQSEMFSPQISEQCQSSSGLSCQKAIVKDANQMSCSPCKVVIEKMPACVVQAYIPVVKDTEFNYRKTDTSSPSNSMQPFLASNFYKKSSNPLRNRVLTKRTALQVPAEASEKPKKLQKKSKEMKSKKKVISNKTVNEAEKMTCSPCKVIIESMSAYLPQATSEPVVKENELSFTDISQNKGDAKSGSVCLTRVSKPVVKETEPTNSFADTSQNKAITDRMPAFLPQAMIKPVITCSPCKVFIQSMPAYLPQATSEPVVKENELSFTDISQNKGDAKSGSVCLTRVSKPVVKETEPTNSFADTSQNKAITDRMPAFLPQAMIKPVITCSPCKVFIQSMPAYLPQATSEPVVKENELSFTDISQNKGDAKSGSVCLTRVSKPVVKETEPTNSFADTSQNKAITDRMPAFLPQAMSKPVITCSPCKVFIQSMPAYLPQATSEPVVKENELSFTDISQNKGVAKSVSVCLTQVSKPVVKETEPTISFADTSQNKAITDRMPAYLILEGNTAVKKTEFNYSFTDTSQNSPNSLQPVVASAFYKNPSNSLRTRLAKRNALQCTAEVIEKAKKPERKSKVVKSKRKAISKSKKNALKHVNKERASPFLEKVSINDEKENPAGKGKFFNARHFEKSQEKVFTTALAWKKGVPVVKSGSSISVKSEPLVKKAVRHPRVRLAPVLKQVERRKMLESVENVPKESSEEPDVPEAVKEEGEPKKSKHAIVRLQSPANVEAKDTELTTNHQEVKDTELATSHQDVKGTELAAGHQEVKDTELATSHQEVNNTELSASHQEVTANCIDSTSSKDDIPSSELAPVKSKTEGNRYDLRDAKLYPLFRQGIRKKQHQEMVCSSTPKRIETPYKLKQKHFIKETKDDGKEQMIIDAGQKEIGAKQCHTCNMVYTIGDAKDEKMHLNYHEKFLTNLKFPGWKKEHVLGEFFDGRVIKVTKQDRKHMLKKIEDVVYIVNRDLGFLDLGLPTAPDATFLLFVTNDKQVVGCLIAESVSKASRVVFDSSENVAPCLPNKEVVKNSAEDPPKGNWCCGSETVKVICGINRIWTAPSHRRQRIASRMVDCLRCNFVYGYVISVDEMAFSDPSLNGRDFAAAYTGTPFFLVYK